MIRLLLLIFLTVLPGVMVQAETLSLDSCRARALRNNKQLSMAKVRKDIAINTRKSVRTKYLPHVDLAGGYTYSSRSISLLNDEQQAMLSNMGTAGMQGLKSLIGSQFSPSDIATGSQIVTNILTRMTMNGLITPAEASALQQMGAKLGGLSGVGDILASKIDAAGQSIVDAFNTNTHHIFMASAMLTQPIYMGGAITAANNMADIGEKMSETNIEKTEQEVIYNTDNAYWLVVSLRQKQKLAVSYLDLVRKLNADVHKMIDEGVATKADGLKVDVAVNEAEMTLTKVDNGLSLAKMYLCQLCGMDLESDIALTDENDMPTTTYNAEWYEESKDFSARPELALLSNSIDLTKEKTKLARAGYLPQVALTGGAIFTNPSVYNGFERKFKGAFTAGVLVRMPVLDWGETAYKIRASKNSTRLAELTYDEAEEMISLQVSQCSFKLKEAHKHLATATGDIKSAEENLRCADLGFKEGVMSTTDVMAAQTAWMKAQAEKIDAEIDVKTAEVAMKKATGRLR